ncbi:hypothetical protein Bhyg_03588, partial [Pseudolycoriella hygida]
MNTEKTEFDIFQRSSNLTKSFFLYIRSIDMKKKILNKLFKKGNNSKVANEADATMSGVEKISKKCVKCKCEKEQCKCIHKIKLKMLPTN